ncbi:MAG TPA: hypothetical protein VLH39_04245 [Magnetospirillaceae bacterium]|nr:hypothetical protein [Magnetospirillaceae bacterium]
MRGTGKIRLECYFRSGMRSLVRHDAQAALRSFQKAVDACPAWRSRTLARYLYWLSIPLLRLGRSELAAKSLASTQKLEPRGPARRLYRHMVNGYGMVSTGCDDRDDFRAFFSIQIRRYLGSRPGGRFRTEAERDAVARIVEDTWSGLKTSGVLANLTCPGKLELFRNLDISFPMQFIERGRALAGDFRRGCPCKLDGRCICGSGLPYMQCCGRTQSVFGAGVGSL